MFTNESSARFKIDFNDFSSWPYALFVRERGWLGIRWVKISTYEKREDARAHYEKIKDLPEYLA